MNTTVVGVFDAYDDAQAASRRLQDECGIDAGSIRVSGGAAEARTVEPTDSDGERPGAIRRFFAEMFGIGEGDAHAGHYSEAVRRGSAVLCVQAADDRRIDEISDVLEDCGAIDIDQRVEQWKAGGWTGYDENAAPYQAPLGEQQQTLPVVEEELQVGKRSVERGRVRVHRHTTERPVEEQLSLREERASIERQRVDRPATEAELRDLGGDRDIEIRETTEELVVSKTARVVEEVRVGKQTRQRSETVRDTVRRSEVDVENLDDLPEQQRTALAGSTLSRYSGPERRYNTGPYGGVERRALH